MVDHLQSRVTPWRQYASHVKARSTLSKMDVFNCLKVDKWVFEVKITIEQLKQEKPISEQHIKEKEHVLLVKINYVEDERHFLLE